MFIKAIVCIKGKETRRNLMFELVDCIQKEAANVSRRGRKKERKKELIN